jgi:hypothetical protein
MLVEVAGKVILDQWVKVGGGLGLILAISLAVSLQEQEFAERAAEYLR